MWAIGDVDFTLVNDLGADPIATLDFRTSAGTANLRAMAEGDEGDE